MIEIVQGVGVGAGKSFYVLYQRIIPHLVRGGTVITSDKFVLKWEALAEYVARKYGLHLEVDQVRNVAAEDVWKLHEVTPPGTDECPVLIIVDEAQSALHTRDSRDGNKRALFDWCCESRHDNNDLVFISQHALNIDVAIRRLATNVIKVRNMATLKIAGMSCPSILIKLGLGFMVLVYDQSEKLLQERIWLPQSKEVFACYESKSCKGAHKRAQVDAIVRKQLQKVAKPKGNNMKLVPLIVIALIAAALYGAAPAIGMFGGKKKQPDKVQLTQQVAPQKKRLRKALERAVSYCGNTLPDLPKSLVTDQATYILGQLSVRGFVKKMDCRSTGGSFIVTVECEDEEGLFFVIADSARKDETPDAQPVKSTAGEMTLKASL